MFGTPKTFATIRKAVEQTGKDIKIICIKTDVNETIPSGAIDLAELIDTSSKFHSILDTQSILMKVFYLNLVCRR